MEPTRPGRNLRELLTQRIRMGKEARVQDYRLMQRLLADDVLREFPRASTFQPVHRKAYPLLSTDMRQRKIKVSNLMLPTMVEWVKYVFRKK